VPRGKEFCERTALSAAVAPAQVSDARLFAARELDPTIRAINYGKVLKTCVIVVATFDAVL
jgi:hypothetical protein